MSEAMSFDGLRVTVLGLGASGEAAARALIARGADVVVLEAVDAEAQRTRAAAIGDATVILGRTDPADLGDADLIVASPGVPWHSPWLAAARAAGIKVWSEIELAWRLGVRPAIAITGTNGKTTTTEMTVAALRAAGVDAAAAGNSFVPLIEAPDATTIVAEVSSFHLQAIEAFRTPVAVLLNLAPDHTDWHGSFEEYGRAKARIVENQGPDDVVIVRADPLCGALVGAARSRRVAFHASSVPLGGAGVEDGWIVAPEGRVVAVDELQVPGRGMLEDAVAAAAAACALGAEPGAAGAGLAGYRARAHRLEHVATIDGVTYINDSKATDPHATLSALAELHDVVLIAGGLDRSHHLADLAEGAPSLRAAVAIGQAAAAVADALEGEGVAVHKADSLEEAVELARSLASPGSTVLLSPACASLDMFANYEARGEAFRAAVERIEGSDR